jgi:hypothetical protein
MKKDYVCWDFNAIRDDSERRGSSENIRREEMEAFNDFIVGSELLDLLLWPQLI